MKSNFFTILVTGMLTLCVTDLYPADKIIVAAADSWPPYIDFDSQNGGLCIEIVRAAFETQGFILTFKNTPWARAIKGVKDGQFDILPNAWLSKERTKFLLYSKPYAACVVKVVKRKGDPFEYTGINSLTGKKIGVVRGADYGPEFNNAKNFSKEEATNLIQNIKKLILGRIDLTLEDEIGLITTLSMNEPELLKKIEFDENPFSLKNFYVASGLENPRHKKIIDAFNNGLEKIKANGTYNKILSSYVLK